MPSALFVISNGFEEIETVTPLDILRRAGVHCVLASLEPDTAVRGRNEIILKADTTMADLASEGTPPAAQFDMIVLPGGPSAPRMSQDERVLDLVRSFRDHGRKIAAICAAPLILKRAGILGDDDACTCHHSVAEHFPRRDATRPAICHDGRIYTSQGAGTSVEFGLMLVAALCGQEEARRIAEGVCWKHGY